MTSTARTSAKKSSYRLIYGIWGALFGLCFPLGAWAADIFIFRGLSPELESIATVHVQNPLHYIIDTAPLFLGLFASFAGIRQDRLKAFAENLEFLVEQRTGELTRRTEDLQRSEQALRGAKQESDAILANIAEGLFLIGPGLSLAGEYSRSLGDMLGQENLAGANLIDLLSREMPADLVDQCRLFFSMMFDLKRRESMVIRANPLEEIHFLGRVLRFGFRRIVDDSSVVRLLGFVEDATRQVELERQVEAERERGEDQMKLLFALLNVSPTMLAEFLEQTGGALDAIEARFEADAHAENYQPLLADLFRRLHNLKGNASTLGLDAYASAAHAAEDEVEALRARETETETVTGKDFLPLVASIADLRRLYGESRELLERTRQMQAAFGDGSVANARTSISAGVRDLLRRRSSEMNREVEMDDSEFDARSVPGEYVSLVRDVLIQLARNSIVHGIESPEERVRNMKPAAGRLRLIARASETELNIDWEDDGRGIDVEALKHRAVAAGAVTADEAAGMSMEEAARLLFVGGVSTADRAQGRAGMDAGRGVGMDLVRERVREVGGRVDVAFAAGKFCRFTIVLPKARAEV